MTEIQADLHLHSNASDGTWYPEELVQAALKAGLGMVALTDHETVRNVAATERLAKEAGLKFFRGVEISATKGQRCFHILGYGIELADKELLELLRHNENLLAERDDDTIKVLIAQGWQLSYAEFAKYTYDPGRGGWKSLNFLIDQGLCTDVVDFFAKIFTRQNNLGFPVFPTVQEVIRVIRGAGGKAVLAHPASEVHGPGLAKTMKAMEEEKFDGFEGFHSRHTAEDSSTLAGYCRKNNLLLTGGSDCHGSFVPSRVIGRPRIMLSDLLLGELLR